MMILGTDLIAGAVEIVVEIFLDVRFDLRFGTAGASQENCSCGGFRTLDAFRMVWVTSAERRAIFRTVSKSLYSQATLETRIAEPFPKLL